MADPRHHGFAASSRRIRLIAGQTLGEALHLRLILLLGLTGAGLIGASVKLREFNFGGAGLKFLGDFGLGTIGFCGTLLAVLATSQLFFGEIQCGAVHGVLTRPVRRWEYLLGKFTGVAGVLAIFVAGLALVLAGLIAAEEGRLHASLGSLPVFLQACALVWFKVTLVAAMTLLICSYAGSAFFASCLGLLLTLSAHLRPLVAEGGAPGWLWVWPNLGLFDAESLLAGGQSPPAIWLAGLVAYWAGYVFLFGVIANYAFKHREF